MTVQKVEDSIVGNRQFMVAVVTDLEKKFGYMGYAITDTMESIQRKEGRRDVVEYLQREYLNG